MNPNVANQITNNQFDGSLAFEETQDVNPETTKFFVKKGFVAIF